MEPPPETGKHLWWCLLRIGIFPFPGARGPYSPGQRHQVVNVSSFMIHQLVGISGGV
jgi:hypothetical protein